MIFIFFLKFYLKTLFILPRQPEVGCLLDPPGRGKKEKGEVNPHRIQPAESKRFAGRRGIRGGGGGSAGMEGIRRNRGRSAERDPRGRTAGQRSLSHGQSRLGDLGVKGVQPGGCRSPALHSSFAKDLSGVFRVVFPPWVARDAGCRWVFRPVFSAPPHPPSSLLSKCKKKFAKEKSRREIGWRGFGLMQSGRATGGARWSRGCSQQHLSPSAQLRSRSVSFTVSTHISVQKKFLPARRRGCLNFYSTI